MWEIKAAIAHADHRRGSEKATEIGSLINRMIKRVIIVTTLPLVTITLSRGGSLTNSLDPQTVSSGRSNTLS